jgi:hypothetical protein
MGSAFLTSFAEYNTSPCPILSRADLPVGWTWETFSFARQPGVNRCRMP